MAEIVRVNAGLSGWAQVAQLVEERPPGGPARVALLNLHCNRLALESRDAADSLRTFQQLPALVHLDLSSNVIRTCQFLGALGNLEVLNLTNNRLESLRGLEGLRRLRVLQVAFNRIQSLCGLSALHGSAGALEVLDLRGNCVDDERELAYLIGCTRLAHLLFRANVGTPAGKLPENGLCRSAAPADVARYRTAVLALLPNLASLDRADRQAHPVDPAEQLDLQVPALRAYQEFLAGRRRGPNPVTSRPVDPNPASPVVPRADFATTRAEKTKKSQGSDPTDRSDQTAAHVGPADQLGDSGSSSLIEGAVLAWLAKHGAKLVQAQAAEAAEAPAPPPPPPPEPPERAALAALETKHAETQRALEEATARLETSSKDLAALTSFLQERAAARAKPSVAFATGSAAEAPASKPATQEDPAALIDQLRLDDACAMERESTLKKEAAGLAATVDERSAAVAHLTERLRHLETQLATARVEFSNARDEFSNTKAALEDEVRTKDAILVDMRGKIERVLEATRTSKAETAQARAQTQALETRILQISAARQELAGRLTDAQAALEDAESRQRSLIDDQRATEADAQALRVRVAQLEGMAAAATQRDAEHRAWVQELKDAHARELGHVTAALAAASSAPAPAPPQLELALARARDDSSKLEAELRDARAAATDERQRRDELATAHTRALQEAAERQQQLAAAAVREKELECAVRDLSKLARELRGRLARSDEGHRTAVGALEERLAAAERSVRLAASRRDDAAALQRELTTARSDAERLLRERDSAVAEAQSVSTTLSNDLEQAQTRVRELEEQLAEARSATTDAVSVKNKMLDDQNQTIAHLKQNLEAKVAEFQRVAAREGELERQLGDETRLARDLQQDVDRLETELAHSAEKLRDARVDRDRHAQAAAGAAAKLSAREDDIARIESQVSRVRDAFRAREAAAVADLQAQLAARDAIVRELKAVVESSSAKVFELEAERDRLSTSFATARREMEAIRRDKHQLEADMQDLVAAMAREKSQMELRLGKLRSVFQEQFLA